VAAEFDDSALMKVFGQGTGVAFPAPAAIARDVCRVYGVREIGRTAAVRERY
jgi:LysR family transcriptional activator of nhaA